MSLPARVLQWARSSAIGAELKRKIKTTPALQPLFKLFGQRIIDYRFPRTFNAEPTNACNLSCRMCPRGESAREIGNMEWALFEKIVAEAASYGPRNFTLHKDGEPLIHPRIVDMVRLIKKSNPLNTAYISTNGLLLTRELSEAFIECGLDIMHVSIGAATPETYKKVRGASLERVEENTLRLLEMKRRAKSSVPDVAVQIIMMEETKNEIRQFVRKWRRRGVTVSVPGFLTWSGAVDDPTLRQRPRMLRYPCHSLWTAPSINWDGTVSICCVDWEAREILGDLNKESLADAWNLEKIRQYRRWHLAGEWDKIPICRDCNYWQEVPDLFYFWQKRKRSMKPRLRGALKIRDTRPENTRNGAFLRICITDGNNRTALAAVRALGEAGHDLVCVEQERFAKNTPICFVSRHVKRAAILPDITDEESSLSKLLKAAAGCDVVLPVSTNMLYFCARHVEKFAADGIAVASPTVGMLDKVNEKPSFLSIAESVGVSTPRSYLPENGNEFEEVVGRIRFPAIVKLASDRGLYLPPWERYRMAENADALREGWERFRKLNPRPLIQEFVDGDGYGYFFLSDGEGNILREMCHRRIREYPIDGGPSTMCITVREPELLGLGRETVIASGFRGVGMVEFKRTKDGRFVALEINPRLWGSLPLAMAAGVNFPDAWARLARGYSVKPDLRYRVGAKVRFIAHDIRGGISSFRRGWFGKAFTVFTDFFRCGVREGVITFKDPSPGITYVLSRILPQREGGK